MKIYAIFNIPNQAYLKIGINGGGAIGYCLHRGKKVFFHQKAAAQSVINTASRLSTRKALVNYCQLSTLLYSNNNKKGGAK